MQSVRARLARVVLAGSVLTAVAIGVAATPVAAAGCVATGAIDRDGTPLTARIINPARAVTGRVDATGCDVGVYFSRKGGLVAGADVFGARYYGVLVDGNGHAASADIRGSRLHDLGDPSLNAARHGQGVAYRGFGGTATGSVTASRVWDYQEAGLNATGPGATARFTANVVTGRGATDVISQNGIQVIFGAQGTVIGNVISNLRFLGPNVGNGVLVVGGPGYGFPYSRGARIEANVINGADIGINVFEIEEDVSPSPLPTSILIARNVIRNTRLTNIEGWDVGVGFQVGISDYANGDRIIGNVVSGAGYDPDVCGDAAVCSPILTDGTIDAVVMGNVLR